MTTRQLRCSCCGGSAGRWEQWPNRDTGWGICRSCVEWVADPDRRGEHAMSADEIHHRYGVEGVNYAPPAPPT